MGDIRILDPRMDPRFMGDPKHRPWPAMYRNHPNSRGPSFCYRPVPIETLTQWIGPQIPSHDYNYLPARFGTNKPRDYYYLAPMYRNALPPPPQALTTLQVPPPVAVGSRMMLMEKPRSRTKSSSNGGAGRSSVPPCTCSVGRTRSLEDVRSEMSEWEEYNDENGNRVKSNPKNPSRQTRRSMENLLEVENHCVATYNRHVKNPSSRNLKDDPKKDDKCTRRRGSYMVRYNFLYTTWLLGTESFFNRNRISNEFIPYELFP